MTMMQKMQAKKSKKGFTLVELVIVIAILAILAAIAIPVITTTINSSKLSTLDSDKTTVDMVLKEAVNTYKASINTTTYNGQKAEDATVSDIFAEQNLDLSILSDRTIGGSHYRITWTGSACTVTSATDAIGNGANGTNGWTGGIVSGTTVPQLSSM